MYIRLNEKNVVISSRFDKTMIDGEIYTSEIDVLGKVMNEDGTFSDYVPTQEELAEQEKQEQLKQICMELDEAQRFNNTDEITRCQQAYADLNNGVTIKTKTEVEAERDEALKDANKWFGYAMNDKGWWG